MGRLARKHRICEDYNEEAADPQPVGAKSGNHQLGHLILMAVALENGSAPRWTAGDGVRQDESGWERGSNCPR